MSLGKTLTVLNQAANLVTKIMKFSEKVRKENEKKESKQNDKLVNALIGLGYKEVEARKRAEGIDKRKPIPDQVREALNKVM